MFCACRMLLMLSERAEIMIDANGLFGVGTMGHTSGEKQHC